MFMDEDNYSPNELKHYGILGMRWGIRRTPEELGHEILKNEHRQAENAAKIAKMERDHSSNPNKRYRKSDARLYKRAEKLIREHDDLELDRAVAEKRQVALEAKAKYKKEQAEAKAAKNAQKKAEYAARVAEKEAKEKERLNSSYLQGKPLREMTDNELRNYLNRKADEQKYMMYNPKKKTFLDEAGEFVKKNGKDAAQALASVSIELGKEAIKNEVHKQWDEQTEKPNSWKKFGNKETKDLSDDALEKLLKRLQNEHNVNNAKAGNFGKGASGMSKEAVDDEIYRILQGLGYI